MGEQKLYVSEAFFTGIVERCHDGLTLFRLGGGALSSLYAFAFAVPKRLVVGQLNFVTFSTII